MKKQKLILITILTVLIAFMDITGIPSAFFINIQIADIEPFYFTLMINFVIIGIVAYFFIRLLCPEWRLGFTKAGLAEGLKKYGVIGIVVAIVGFIAFYVGLMPFDRQPSIAKVFIEGVIYYIGVAIIEELYVRGLLLNLIEKLFTKNKNDSLIAVLSSSAIFGFGHIFGTLGQPLFVIIAKVIWTFSMGMYFGVIYKQTNNLWLPTILHFVINICALPYCFTTMQGYSNVSLYIILPTYIILGIYSLHIIKRS